jgi:hypothetical protein
MELIISADQGDRRARALWSMIPKKPAPDLIRSGYRFSEKIMLKQQAKAKWRFNPIAL